MDVDQRLEEIRQMAVGLRDLDLAPESHGHLLAALYFCEGVTALPAVVGQFSELHHAECRNCHAELEDRLIDVQNHAISSRDMLVGLLGKHVEMLTGLAEASQVQVQALRRLVLRKDGTYEIVSDVAEESEHTSGWRDENGPSEGTTANADR